MLTHTHPSKSIQQPATFANFFMCTKIKINCQYCRYNLIIGITVYARYVIFICITEQYMLWHYKLLIFTRMIVNIIKFGDTISENTIIGVHVCKIHITFPSCKLISEVVTMTDSDSMSWAKGWDHSMAEYHDPVLYVIVFYKQLVLRYIWEIWSHLWYYFESN